MWNEMEFIQHKCILGWTSLFSVLCHLAVFQYTDTLTLWTNVSSESKWLRRSAAWPTYLGPEDGGIMFLRNINNPRRILHDNTTQKTTVWTITVVNTWKLVVSCKTSCTALRQLNFVWWRRIYVGLSMELDSLHLIGTYSYKVASIFFWGGGVICASLFYSIPPTFDTKFSLNPFNGWRSETCRRTQPSCHIIYFL